MNTKTRNTHKVAKLVAVMLTENTGSHMLDSGGHYGRNHERNKGKNWKDFAKEPQVSIETDADGEYEYYTISLFHYLIGGLSLDGLCDVFNKKFIPTKNWDGGELENVYGVSRESVEWLKAQRFMFGDTFNSYDGDSALSQVIQGTWLKHDGADYLLLQIHGGCDVRGGYTDARLFYVHNKENGALCEDVDGMIVRKDGRKSYVSNRYDGVNLTIEDADGGTNIPLNLKKGDQLELWLSEI